MAYAVCRSVLFRSIEVNPAALKVNMDRDTSEVETKLGNYIFKVYDTPEPGTKPLDFHIQHSMPTSHNKWDFVIKHTYKI